MTGPAVEVDELCQNAGKKSTPHRYPSDPPRRRANKRKGHGTYTNNRRPIISIISRDTGEQRFWVCDHADKRTCADLIAENVRGRARSSTPMNGRVTAGAIHPMPPSAMGSTNGPEMTMGTADARSTATPVTGAGAALRTYLRAFRRVHKQYIYLYVAAYEAMLNAKRVTSQLIRRMCVGNPAAHASYT